MRKSCSKHPFYSMFLLVSLLGILANGHAQVIMEAMPNAKPMDASVIIYGSSNFSNGIPYNKVQGSPFLQDNWQWAILYGKNSKERWMVPSRLNLVSGEIHFKDKSGEEMVAPADMVHRIVFYRDKDTTKALAVFANDIAEPLVNIAGKNNYTQLLNEGNYQLLKLQRKQVQETDSFHIAKRYSFREETKYFLQYKGKTAALKKLAAADLLAYLPGAAAYQQWIDENKLNFKKEEDVVRFLDYYNSKK